METHSKENGDPPRGTGKVSAESMGSPRGRGRFRQSHGVPAGPRGGITTLVGTCLVLEQANDGLVVCDDGELLAMHKVVKSLECYSYC